MKVKKGRTVSEEAIEIANEISGLLLDIRRKFGIKSDCKICLVSQKKDTLLKVEIENSFALSSVLPPQVTGSPQRIKEMVIAPLISILASL